MQRKHNSTDEKARSENSHEDSRCSDWTVIAREELQKEKPFYSNLRLTLRHGVWNERKVTMIAPTHATNLDDFTVESRTISALHHPNIVQILGISIGHRHQHPIVVIEHTQEETLYQ